MELFRASPLPNPPKEYDPVYMRQFIRSLENYFSQLDSQTPNAAYSYTANRFVGGIFSGRAENVTTTEKNAMLAEAGQIVFDTTLGKLCVYTGSAWQTITSV
jgi:hypothetical protein